ncbi:MAG: hypothetical protein M3Q34_01895 [bacterium]|nr:hypothetical protein [bacterium]
MISRFYIAAFSILISVTLFILTSQTAYALDGSQFNPGRIIDDSLFFNGNTMSESSIQSFLDAKVPTCDTNGAQPSGRSGYPTRADWGRANGYAPPYTCLKDYRMSTSTRPAETGLCSTITARSNRTATQIIDEVSSSCGISEKVILVLLQKEQSLITDEWPWTIQYRSATGYGCPDTAPCDSEYYGFFNQVYNAARQYKRYVRDSNLFNYRVGQNANIYFHPDLSRCGSSTVNIQNNATAGLYNYTPYQPNVAALSNLYGTGNSCSAYGNRNFWRIYSDWFGSTTSSVPIVHCDESSFSNLEVGVNFSKAKGTDRASMIKYTKTGSDCVELHTWNNSYDGWITNQKTHTYSFDPTVSEKELVFGDIDGDGTDELHLIKYNGTGSGMIEIHTYDSSLSSWRSNIATNHPQRPKADVRVVFGDIDSDGTDEAHFVKYANTGSGQIEIHTWSSDYKSWIYNRSTNHSAQ